MTSSDILTLALVATAGVLAPLLADVTRRVGIPSIVFEIALGVLIGPQLLGWATPDPFVNGLSDLGLSFLMFLAGYEIRLERIVGAPLIRAAAGWGISLVLGLAVAFALVSSGFALDNLVLGLTLTTTALGTLLPILRDVGVLETRVGAYVLAIGTVGEFGPIVAIVVLLTGHDPLPTALLLVAFTVLAAGTALLATRRQPPALIRVLRNNLTSASQLPVRAAVLLIVLLVLVAFHLGLDILLGAFASGIIVRLALHGDEREVVQSKLEALGFGFLVPIFFIVSGMRFDLHALVSPPTTLLRIPLFLVLFLVVRGVPAILLYRSDVKLLPRSALALLSSTGLPLIVVITTLGVQEHRMLPQNAAALVGAGLLSVLIYPLVALRLLQRDQRAAARAVVTS